MSRVAPQAPSALAAEAWLLGAFLCDSRLIPNDLTPADFFEPGGVNGTIMRAVYTLAAAKRPVDVVSVAEWLQAENMLEAIGGPMRLGDLRKSIGTTVGVEHYLGLVRDAATRRAIMDAGTSIVALAAESTDAADVVTRAENIVKIIIGRIRERGTTALIPMAAIVDREYAAFQGRLSGMTLAAVSTGLRELDRLLGGGLFPGDLTFIAGRPAMGKSALSSGMAVACAHREEFTSTHNLEMGQAQQLLRVWSADAKVPMPWLRNPKSSPLMLRDATASMARLSEFGRFLFIQNEDRPVTVEQFANDVRRTHEAVGLKLATLDYLQLVKASDRRDGREQQIAHITRSLKSLAKELGIPIVCLAQVNRQCEGRTDKRPMLSDLRESGAIEQDADNVLFCYRDEYYHADSSDRGTAEIIVAKQRNGETGTARVAFVDRYALFADLIPHVTGAEWASAGSNRP